jgi:pimeloyl-ACP methyl ester carboxylesterase
MPTLVVDDRVVSYEDRGAGPVVALVHGSPGNARAWQRIGGLLADRHRVIAPDLPGHGATTPQPPDATPDVAYSAALLDALFEAVGRPALLVGYSYGGVVALGLALRRRVAIGALALLEPVAVPVLGLLADEALHARTRAVFETYIAEVEAGDATRVQTMIDVWFGPGAFARMSDAARASVMRAASINIRDVRGTLRQVYTPEALAALPVPLTTIVGSRSPEVTWAIARTLGSGVPGGKVVELEGADHGMLATHAEALARLLAGLTPPTP